MPLDPDKIGEFDSLEWSRVYDDSGGPAQNFVFRRSLELALELSAPMIRRGARWLDAGCGPGHLVRSLHATEAYCIGADHDERMIAFARRSSDFAAPMVVARAEQLPFASASLDGVVATSLVGCLPLAASFLVETHRVLRTDGHAVITFTNQLSLLLKLNRLLAPSEKRIRRYHLYHPGQVTRDLKKFGFEIERVKFYNFVLHARNRLFPPPKFARRLDAVFGCSVGRVTARNFIVVARKIGGAPSGRGSP